MTEPDDPFSFAGAQLRDPATHWNMGGFGAIAEFMRDPDERVRLEACDAAVLAVTGRGGIALRRNDGLQLVAYESTTRESWSHAVALCLPAEQSETSRRKVLTELGTDGESLRKEDRGAILFDLGLDLPQVDVLVRTSDDHLVRKLRCGFHRPVFAHDNPAMAAILAYSPHRVFVTKIGRVEVYQAIPPANGKSPEGPHTHVLPKLLQHKRTHAATEPIPAGWVPCAHFHPAHPVKDGSGRFHPFDADNHRAFQAMLAFFGNPQANAIKRQVRAAIEAAKGPSEMPLLETRFDRAAIRVALRQLAASDDHLPALPAWLAAYDRATPAEETGDPYEH